MGNYDLDVYCDVMYGAGRRYIHPGKDFAADIFYIPLIVAAAAGRFGHSMIRLTYPWSSSVTNVDLGHFIERSYFNSYKNFTKLTFPWIVDWTKFFDFTGVLGLSVGPPALAKRIDPILESPLGGLPEIIRQPRDAPPIATGFFNLAQATLQRQLDFALPTAQMLIADINTATGLALNPLSVGELKCANHPALMQVMTSHPLLITETPIWFYVLREAELRGGGDRLGPLGSRLVMETIHAAIDASSISILHDKSWAPDLMQGGEFTLVDLIMAAGGPNH